MIKRLKVRNFKSLRDFDLELGPLNVLVGPNMAGKSNIVDVLRFLQESLYPPSGAEGIPNALIRRGGMGEVLWKGGDENLLSLALESAPADGTGEVWFYELEVLLAAQGYTYNQKESLKVRRAGKEFQLIGQEAGERWLVNSDGRKIVSGRSPSRSALERAAPDWEGHVVAESIGTWRFHQLVPGLMKNMNQVGVGPLAPTGSNVSAWLMRMQTGHPEEFNKINQVAKDVFPGFQNLLTSISEPGGMVYLSSREAGLKRPVNVWQMSDGELAFLALLSLIYSPPEAGADLFCIEEPENHLHPGLLSTLVKLLRQTRQEIQQSSSDLAQIIVTTHSPHLLDQFTLDEVVWVEKKNGNTVASRPNDREHLRQLVKDKELGLGDIVYSGLLNEQG